MSSGNIRELFRERGYSEDINNRNAILEVLDALNIGENSELGTFYLACVPEVLRSKTSMEQLNGAVVVLADDTVQPDPDPFETPVGMATLFVREVWNIPETFICLTSTEGEGAYLFDLSSHGVFDFDLNEQSALCEGILEPRWKSFFEFLEWYLA